MYIFIGLNSVEDVSYLIGIVERFVQEKYGRNGKTINGEEESFPDCCELWRKCKDDDETSDSLTVWLGDGGTTLSAKKINEYIDTILNLRENSYFAFGKFGNIPPGHLPSRFFDFDPSVVLLDIGDMDLYTWLKNDCYEYITTRTVSFQDEGSKVQQKIGFFEADNGYNAIVDEEILYGATLTVDYKIGIETKEELSNINITDYIPEGMQVISTEPGGTYNPNDNTVTFDIKETVTDEKVVKLTLSKVLTSAEDIQEMENTADVIVTTSKGETFSTIPDNPYATEQEKYDARVHSKKVSIIPPFGSNEEKQESIIEQINKHGKIILLTIIWILVALSFVKHIKNRNIN